MLSKGTLGQIHCPIWAEEFDHLNLKLRRVSLTESLLYYELNVSNIQYRSNQRDERGKLNEATYPLEYDTENLLLQLTNNLIFLARHRIGKNWPYHQIDFVGHKS